MPLALVCAVALGAQDAAERAWTTVDLWVEAVDTHDPGADDAAVRSLTALSTVALEEALPYVALVLRTGLGTNGTEPFDSVFRRLSREMTLSPVETARLHAFSLRITRPSTVGFLKRAVMLHTDAALRYPGSHLTSSEGTGQLSADGRNFGLRGRSWHWLLAHAFAHLVLYEQPNDADIRLWFQAIGNYFWSRSNYTEGRPHLDRGVAAFPADAELLFLRGVNHEALGEPHIQAAIEEQRRLVERRRGERYVTSIGSSSVERRRAAEAFEEALRYDPEHWEARLRLGRLLGLAGRHSDAVAALNAVLEAVDAPWLRYHAFMFLGRAQEARGQVPDAFASYESARALFPDAQSPLLALARLHVQAGALNEAHALLRRLSERRAPDSDPWWHYDVLRVPQGDQAWLRRLRIAFRGAAR